MKDITFVLLTCGELSERKCLQAIQHFRDEIEFIVIRNVYPQIKALNLMIESVQTEYFIPLDADMVLYPDAWDRIGNAFRKHRHNPGWHSILFPLWDTLTEKKILALKLMRTSIMKANQFMDVPTPDVEHYQRLTKQGYTCIHDYLKQRPIGDHVVQGKHFCYFKYRDMYQTLRAHNIEWDSGAFLGGKDLLEKSKNHFDYFFIKWVKTDNPDYLHCISGMLDGVTSPLERKSKSLGKRSYAIDSQFAAGQYLHWYAMEKIKCQERLMF